MFHLTDISNMSSTLVETVSIDCEDFSDSFLTCGTCLCMYDSQERSPKLLSCSHTVCYSCLERIIGMQGPESTSFRCPICRELIAIPRGGVSAFPPSFIVNQLLDLMARQRRDIVPKCSVHLQSELMFCESCDAVFCTECTGGTHNSRGASAHTVIPFAIAIKRMSEILLYKASLCMKNLNTAFDEVTKEMNRLDLSTERCVETADHLFQDVMRLVEHRRQEVIHNIRHIRDEKKQVLREQLDIVEAEKTKVQSDCRGLQHQVEVRNITTKISELNEKLDISSTLLEPRENAYMKFEYCHNDALPKLALAVGELGTMKISKTFPMLCTAVIEPAVVHLKSKVVLTAVDYQGCRRTSGGDPVSAELKYGRGEVQYLNICDNEDGTYVIEFTASNPGLHHLCISIFDRFIKDSPLVFEVSEHINPVKKFGKSGSGDLEFKQPVNNVIGQNGQLYILDTGNSRIKVLDESGQFLHHLNNQGLQQNSGTGMTILTNGNLVIVNWRTKCVTEICPNSGATVHNFYCEEFIEPVSIASNSRDELIVADNGLGKLIIFDRNGKKLRTVGSKGDKPGHLKMVSFVYSTPNDEIVVCDHRLQVFSCAGQFLYALPRDQSIVKGQYGGVTVDRYGNLLVTKSERGRCIVQVFNAAQKWMFDIDSWSDRLKRPSGLATTDDGHVYVVDLGNDCIKKFRYM